MLRQLGLKFEVMPSHAPEVHEEQLTAREVSQLNAYRKAREIAKLNPDALVLGADTLVYLGTELFGKHLIAIEVAGALLLAAIVGAAVIISQGKTTIDQRSTTNEP